LIFSILLAILYRFSFVMGSLNLRFLTYTRYKYVSNFAIKLLKEGFDLHEHLVALRRYHFMEQADWADSFIMSLRNQVMLICHDCCKFVCYYICYLVARHAIYFSLLTFVIFFFQEMVYYWTWTENSQNPRTPRFGIAEVFMWEWSVSRETIYIC